MNENPKFEKHGLSAVFSLAPILLVFLFYQLFAFPTFAQSLDNYCIALTDYKLQSKPIIPSIDEPEPVHITVKGKAFHIVIQDRWYLKIIDENNKPLSKAGVWQGFGRVHNVVLGKNGWLWIDGDDRGYMVKLDLTRELPTLGKPVPLPDLKARPYSMIEKWWSYDDSGFRATGDYSPLLDRVFITGHRVTLFGTPDLATYEVIAGQAKLLPEPLQGARLVGGERYREVGGMSYHYYEDLSHLNGVLFEGQKGEAYFYDGVKGVSLLTNYLDSSVEEKKRKWIVEQAPISQRIFLRNFVQKKPFFIELKAGPNLTPIAIPEELADRGLWLYEFPNDPQLFAISRYVVMVETKDGLQIVATAQEPSYIGKEKYADTNLMPDKAIGFTVFNPVTKTSTGYLIINNPLSERCIATPNTDKPIVLGDK